MLFGKKKRRISRLLVVEDEPLVAFDNEHFLGDAGYEVVATVDSVAAALIELQRAEQLDLMLLDLNLADGNGLEVARMAREREVHVLFVTGHCPEEGRSLSVGCLAKPYAQRDLLSAIEAVEAALEGKPTRKLPPSFRLFLPQ